MLNKLIILGIVLFLIGVLGWFVAVIFSVVTFGEFRGAANFFGIVAAVSLPATIILAIVNFIKNLFHKK